MSTLEHPDGDGTEPQPSREQPGAVETPDPAPADDDGGPASASGVSTDPDTSEAAERVEASTLERPEQSDPLEAEEIAVAPGEVRHAPRYGRFATVGGLLGLAVAFLLTPFARYDEPGMVMDPWGFGLLLGAILTPIGILVGCILALVADRRSRRVQR